ncbi:hypothetical protein Tco_0858661 [Tanacetum coccineum]|uniref:Uncharacterized protein n=1 Tax=Tanacetum coccineum TaxID=301880 RepID=A0ABQ5BFF3_9ASTR
MRSHQEATMKIIRGDNPLNLIVHPNFRLKSLGFSKWLEIHALASKKYGKSNDMNLVPPPGVVPITGLVINDPEPGVFFMNRNTDVLFHRESEFHLTPTVQLIQIQNQIKVDSQIADDMFRQLILVIEARSDCIEAREIVKWDLDNLG